MFLSCVAALLLRMPYSLRIPLRLAMLFITCSRHPALGHTLDVVVPCSLRGRTLRFDLHCDKCLQCLSCPCRGSTLCFPCPCRVLVVPLSRNCVVSLQCLCRALALYLQCLCRATAVLDCQLRTVVCDLSCVVRSPSSHNLSKSRSRVPVSPHCPPSAAPAARSAMGLLPQSCFGRGLRATSRDTANPHPAMWQGPSPNSPASSRAG